MSQNIQKYHLLLIHDSQGQRVMPLDCDQYCIGRTGKDAIKIFDPTVSRQHAVLTRVSDDRQNFSYQITDGDNAGTPSKNGLFVNGLRTRSKLLQSSDSVQIGTSARIIYLVEKFTQQEFDLYCHSGVLAFQDTQGKKQYQKKTLVLEI